MNQTAPDDSLDQEDILDPDEEIEQQLDWEESLERQYGGLSDDMEEKNSRAMGTGFSKQKQVIEENEFYRGTGKKKKIFLKHSK